MADRFQIQLDNIARERKTLYAEGKSLTDEMAKRDLTDEEQSFLDNIESKAAELDRQEKTVKDSQAMIARVEGIGNLIPQDEPSDQAPQYKSMGEYLTKSDEFKSFARSGYRGSTGPIEVKADFFSQTDGDAMYAGVRDNVRSGILPILYEQATVASAFAQGTLSGDRFVYMVESLADNSLVGTVAEGGAKPLVELELDRADEPMAKVAAFLDNISEETMQDVDGIRSYIDGRLSLFVRLEEDNQVLNGAGAGSDLTGILARVPVGNQNITASLGGDEQAADHIRAAIAKAEESYLTVDTIILNPADWMALQLLKDGDKNYMGSGPFSAPQAPGLWGKRVIVSSAYTAGTALVGAFQQGGQVFYRGPLTVEFTNSGYTGSKDRFRNNLYAARAEQRMLLAVYRPEAFATANI